MGACCGAGIGGIGLCCGAAATACRTENRRSDVVRPQGKGRAALRGQEGQAGRLTGAGRSRGRTRGSGRCRRRALVLGETLQAEEQGWSARCRRVAGMGARRRSGPDGLRRSAAPPFLCSRQLGDWRRGAINGNHGAHRPDSRKAEAPDAGLAGRPAHPGARRVSLHLQHLLQVLAHLHDHRPGHRHLCRSRL